VPAEFRCEALTVLVFEDVAALAARAAADAAAELRRLAAAHREVNAIFAGAESQMEFHRALAARTDVDWSAVNAFAVDDFWCPGMPEDCRVAAQPARDLYSRVRPRSVNSLNPDAPDPEAEARRYQALLRTHRPHLACIGIGVSGHLALNEPGACSFGDERWVRVAALCSESKRQLESDPNFRRLPAIPERGITCTIPALMAAERVMAIVPYRAKAAVIRRFFQSPAGEALPATALKTQPGARLYLDADSFSESRGLFPREAR